MNSDTGAAAVLARGHSRKLPEHLTEVFHAAKTGHFSDFKGAELRCEQIAFGFLHADQEQMVPKAHTRYFMHDATDVAWVKVNMVGYIRQLNRTGIVRPEII